MAGQHLALLSFQKKADKLDMNVAELSVWGVQEGQHYPCIIKAKETNIALNFFTCEIQGTSDTTFQQLVVNLFLSDCIVTAGRMTVANCSTLRDITSMVFIKWPLNCDLFFFIFFFTSNH